MGKTLGRKQNISNLDWIETIAGIEDIVTKKELDQLVEDTVKEIIEKTKEKKSAFAWSGGKDSLVLEKLCYMAGITDCVLVICNLEYRAFLQWVDNNKPSGLTTINTKQDIKWITEHPEMLFPQDSKTAAKWFHNVQHRGQEKYYKENNLDLMLLGRRKADGNYVGKGDNTYTNRQGIVRYSPLSDWKHEQILAFIHYYKVPIPPLYGWYNGYKCGTHPWAARQWTGSIQNAWKEIYEIEPDIVAEASKYIISAFEYLKFIDNK